MAPLHDRIARRGRIPMVVCPGHSWSNIKLLGSRWDRLSLHRGKIPKRMVVVSSENQ